MFYKSDYRGVCSYVIHKHLQNIEKNKTGQFGVCVSCVQISGSAYLEENALKRYVLENAIYLDNKWLISNKCMTNNCFPFQMCKIIYCQHFCVLSRLTRLWMAVVGAVVTLAGPAASAAEVEEPRVAFITLWSIHSRLAHTYS